MNIELIYLLNGYIGYIKISHLELIYLFNMVSNIFVFSPFVCLPEGNTSMSMTISGSDEDFFGTYHPWLAYFLGLCKGISPQNIALDWYSTSIL